MELRADDVTVDRRAPTSMAGPAASALIRALFPDADVATPASGSASPSRAEHAERRPPPTQTRGGVEVGSARV